MRLIKVEYEELPYSLNLQDSMSGKIDNVFPEGAVFGEYHHTVGEKPEGDLVEIETTTDIGRINHVCMETHACVARLQQIYRGADHLVPQPGGVWYPYHGGRAV